MKARGGKRASAPAKYSAEYQLLVRTLQQSVVLSLAVFGFLFSLVSVYSLEVTAACAVWTAAAFVLLFTVVCSFKRRGLFLLFTLLAGILWAMFHASALLQGFLLLVDQALSPINLSLPASMQSTVAAASSAPAAPRQ